MIVLNMIRSDPSDITSLYAMSVGAAKLSDLQKDPSIITKNTSSPVKYNNPLELENPYSSSSSFFWVRTDNTGTVFDLFSIQLYDYPLAGNNLKTAARDSWAKCCSSGTPLADGQAIKCIGNPNIYEIDRYEGNNTYSAYTDPATAASWDPNWGNPTMTDCDKFTKVASRGKNPNPCADCRL